MKSYGSTFVLLLPVKPEKSYFSPCDSSAPVDAIIGYIQIRLCVIYNSCDCEGSSFVISFQPTNTNLGMIHPPPLL